MDSKPGILILSPFFRPNIGGVETHLNDLCRYLQNRSYTIRVITYQPLTTRARGKRLEKEQYLEIHRISWFGHNWFHKLEPYPLLQFLYLTPGLLVYTFFFMFRNQKKIDVVHAHGLAAAFIAKIIALVYRKRAVMSTHAIYNLKPGSRLAEKIQWILSSFLTILTLSRQSREELVNIGVGKEKVKVYTYWVDQELFRPMNKENCKKEVGWEEKFIVLFVGRLLEIKGVETLLQTAESVNKEINFAFLGDGPLNNKVKETVSRQSNVIFSGPAGNERLPLYYNAADLVIVPSHYQEGYGRVILESLSCGTPVIASNIGGIKEAMDNSVGRLIEPSAEKVAETLEHLFTHPEEIEKMAVNCHPYAENKFSSANARLIEESYFNSLRL